MELVKQGKTIKQAIYAGSFDPLTRGHIWMIEQAAGIFQELIVAVGVKVRERLFIGGKDVEP